MKENETFKIKGSELDKLDLSTHLAKYIGQTVTIFVTTGGEGGVGFTGVILSVNRCFLRLITRIGPVPKSPLGNECTFKLDSDYKTVSNNLGSITDIPIDKIVAFTHNSI
ncbi:hypothetical protein ADU90_01275 [Clostridium botulinum]|uniref:hypothetical protein n=2 Tax=Clostridium botulinum TaxID=1491 RepID=UPI0004D59315|nr:hypothetical protein [Clostridium botulinum]KEI00703.1 hypothetical protein Z952_00355 [Clostridium botulinum C/D str. BKT75002]KEI08449.1 hypothetical protein Z954_01215 [Clostridium botulinum C/D str. BKT2873]KGM96708.1 hypothetical protein Z956_02335 [Clostridium botulinum D str. CCUG 7971]KOC51286.1 hypothetical protein ADU88_00270 [Clostridium botulinum]KOC54955.1 hypothetical protein ADU89_06810 [Clostridium botulinum]